MTTLPPLADVSALEALLGQTLAGADLSRASAVLDAASALIRSEAGDDFTGGVPAIVEQVCLWASMRAFRNPDGVAQSSVGDVSVSYRSNEDSGAVFLTRDERRQVRKAAGSPGVVSVPMVTAGLDVEEAD